MIKYAIALAALATPTAAQAEVVVLDLDRMSLIGEAAKTICRSGMESNGHAVATVERESSYLKLNRAERLYLYSLCVLYAQGRVDVQ